MKYPLTYCFALLMLSLQAQTLPGYRDGTWWIIKNGKEQPLPETCSHLGNFDEQTDRAVFIENNRYGVIDGEGQVVVAPDYRTIATLGYNLYDCSTADSRSIYDAEKKANLTDSIDGVELLNERYALIHYHDSLRSLLFLPDRSVYPLVDSSTIMGSQLGSVFVREGNDSLRMLFTEEGQKRLFNATDIQYGYNFIIYDEEGYKRVITAEINLKLRNEPHVWLAGTYLSYYDGIQAHLINTTEHREVISGPYEQIRWTFSAEDRGFFVSRNGKTGYMDAQGNVRIPIRYDAVNRTSDGYQVQNGSLSGLYDRQFNMRVPPEFYSFRQHGDFMYTYSINGDAGLYSLLSRKTILKPIYSRILFMDDTRLKAYFDGNIRILELNERHQVQKDVVLPNAISVKQVQHPEPDPTHRFDRRLLDLGWYFVRHDVLDSLGRLVKYRYRWGLKDLADSGLLDPRFEEPLFMPRQSFSLVPIGRLPVKAPNGAQRTELQYAMRSHHTGKTLLRDKVLQMDTLDCLNRSFVRYQSSEGYRILLPNDSVKEVSYVSSEYGQYLPYCEGGKRVYCNKLPDAVLIADHSLNGRSHHFLSVTDRITKEEMSYQQFIGGRWNYLDSNANDLFDEPFEFAGEFMSNRAIVKRTGGWGVIRPDTVIIPLIYSGVDRFMLSNKDTLFRVMVNRNEFDLMDNRLNKLPYRSDGLLKASGEMSVVRSGRDVLLLNGTELRGQYSTVPLLLNANYVAIRDKKEYHIFDPEGRQIGNIQFKPAEIMSEQLVVVKHHGKEGLINFAGDTLVGFGDAEITRCGELIFVKGKYEQRVLAPDGTEVVESGKGETLYIDPLRSEVIIAKGNRCRVLNAEGTPVRKFKWKQPESLEQVLAGMYFTKHHLILGDSAILLGKGFRFEAMDDGYFAMLEEDRCTVYKGTVDRVVFETQAKRIKYIGEGTFTYRNHEGVVVQTADHRKVLPDDAEIESPMNNGHCLVRVNRTYCFLNAALEDLFNRHFERAHPFVGNFASIKTHEGWTLIDQSGIQQSFPSFSEIQPLGEGLFQVRQKPLYGLYTSDGQQILPPEYEKITLLYGRIIQVIRDGEIGYFDTEGNPIFELQVQY